MPQTIVSGVQHQTRRGSYAQALAFTGAQGEVIYDTTYNRPLMHDGVTQGGFAASAASVQNSTGTATIKSNVAVVLCAFTASGTLTLPAANVYIPGQVLTICDVAGTAGSDTITINTASTTDQIYTSTGHSTQFTISVAGKSAQLISNSSAKWVGAGSL